MSWQGREPLDVLGYDLARLVRDIKVPDPGAGKEWTYTNVGGEWLRVVIGVATLAVSKQAGERGHMMWQVKDGDGNVRSRTFGGTEIIVAPRTYLITYIPMTLLANNDGITNKAVMIPSMWIPPGWSVGSFTADIPAGGLQSEDAHTGIRLLCEVMQQHGDGAGDSLTWDQIGALHATPN